MKLYASLVPSQQQVKLKLNISSKKIVSASLNLTISCVFIREGKATYVEILFIQFTSYFNKFHYFYSDEDMQSLASLMSVNTTGDIAPLEDFEEEEGINTK